MPSLPDRSPELESLLEYVKRSRGIDFTGYKPTSLSRRIQKRMADVHVDSFDRYREHLEANPGEFDQLVDTILINVTGFFRDAETWQYLRAHVIPQLIEQKDPNEPIRVWSAGCATGEEAYTLAIAFAEALGLDRYRERVKIYATDVDEPALIAARAARYTARDVADLPRDIVEKYFERVDSQIAFRKDLRRSVVFGRNDLVQDAPISRIDLLTCRNALMYFDAPTQGRILARLFFALNDGGYLFLGKAETLLAHTSMFTPVDLKRRIFQKLARGRSGPRALQAVRSAGDGEGGTEGGGVRDAALRAGSVCQLVVDRQARLVFANDRANALFRLDMADVGRPLSDLDLSYRPVDVRSLIDQAYAERRVVLKSGIEWPTPGTGETRWFDLQVIPLHGDDGGFVGTSLAFNDVTVQRELQLELQQLESELQAAYEEVQSTNEELETTNEELQSTVEELETTNEELETTNEELQSTVEELETTNEELQSTNEELETMNEELQSTNEELQTMNDQLRLRGDELNQVNRFLEQVFTSLRHGVAIINPELQVLVWNRKAEDLWGLRAEEAEGAHFLNLDIGLPVDQLRQPIRNALAMSDGAVQEVVLPAVNRLGRGVDVRVVCAPLVGREAAEAQGVIVIMEEVGSGDGAT